MADSSMSEVKKILENIKENRVSINKNLVDEYKKKKFLVRNETDKKREEIYLDVETTLENIDIINKKIFSINVPTGTGKTLTSLNAALKLRDRLGQNNRIIYNLPFTSIIDQNYDVFEEVLGEISKEIRNNLLAFSFPSSLLHHGQSYDLDVQNLWQAAFLE